METATQKLLVVGAETPALHRVAPLLLRAEFEIVGAERAEQAITLVRASRFDLIVARYPLAGGSLGDLVGALRAAGSASREASFLLLADVDAAGEVGAFLGRGVNRIVSLDATSDTLLHAIAGLLAVAPRRALRMPVQLVLWYQGDATGLAAQTVNLSTNGVLVSGAQRPPVGSRLSFDLSLPGEASPIRGEAEVVRHAEPAREQAPGFAARFVAFHGDSWHRLRTFLQAET